MTNVHRLYNAGDAAFLTNVGALVEPMTKAEYLAQEGRRPPSLFAHNVQVLPHAVGQEQTRLHLQPTYSCISRSLPCGAACADGRDRARTDTR